MQSPRCTKMRSISESSVAPGNTDSCRERWEIKGTVPPKYGSLIYRLVYLEDGFLQGEEGIRGTVTPFFDFNTISDRVIHREHRFLQGIPYNICNRSLENRSKGYDIRKSDRFVRWTHQFLQRKSPLTQHLLSPASCINRFCFLFAQEWVSVQEQLMIMLQKGSSRIAALDYYEIWV